MNYKSIYLFFSSIILFSCNNNITSQNIINIQDTIKTYRKTKNTHTKIINIKIKIINELSEHQPEKYNNLKIKSDIIKENIDDLNLFIDALKKESNCNYFDKDKNDLMSDTSLYNQILFLKNKLSRRGLEFKGKIDFLYKKNNELFVSNPMLNQYNKEKFNTNIFFNNGNKKIDYMTF